MKRRGEEGAEAPVKGSTSPVQDSVRIRKIGREKGEIGEKGATIIARSAFPHPPPLPFSSSFDSTVSNGTTFFPDLRNRPAKMSRKCWTRIGNRRNRRETRGRVARGRGGELCAHKSRGNIYRRKKNPWIDTTVESACSGGSVGRGSDSLRIGARA